LVEPLPGAPRDKQARREALAERAQADFLAWMREHEIVARDAVPAAGVRAILPAQ
jgi:hypothetical protein